jgi:hypothetical protein
MRLLRNATRGGLPPTGRRCAGVWGDRCSPSNLPATRTVATRTS